MSSSDGEQLHEDMLDVDMSEYFLGGSGVTSEQLRALDPRALVELALQQGRDLKLVWIELARRGPQSRDAVAERRLVELYREGLHHGWVTASLLRYVGGSRSYDVARDILLKGAGSNPAWPRPCARLWRPSESGSRPASRRAPRVCLLARWASERGRRAIIPRSAPARSAMEPRRFSEAAL
jgi:hypothetical protein